MISAAVAPSAFGMSPRASCWIAIRKWRSSLPFFKHVEQRRHPSGVPVVDVRTKVEERPGSVEPAPLHRT